MTLGCFALTTQIVIQDSAPPSVPAHKSEKEKEVPKISFCLVIAEGSRICPQTSQIYDLDGPCRRETMSLTPRTTAHTENVIPVAQVYEFGLHPPAHVTLRELFSARVILGSTLQHLRLPGSTPA